MLRKKAWPSFSLLMALCLVSACKVLDKGNEKLPVLKDRAITIQEDQKTIIAMPEGFSARAYYVIDSHPKRGMLRFVNGVSAIEYTPFKDRSGVDHFALHVVDGAQTTNQSTNNITISPANDPPRIIDAPPYMDGDGVSIEFSDAEGHSFTISAELIDGVNIEVEGQTVTLSAPSIDAVTTVTLRFRVEDVEGAMDTLTHEIDILPSTQNGLGRTIFGKRHSKGLDLVVVGDGYQENEMGLLTQDAFALLATLHLDEGIRPYMPAWNIHVLSTISKNSGVDNSGDFDFKDTFFEAHMNCMDIERLTCANQNLAITTALDEIPETDFVVMVLNTTQFGGAGGFVAIYTRGHQEVAVHELGHTFALLADEYVDEAIADNYPEIEEGQYANVSTVDDAGLVPWSHFLDLEIYTEADNGEIGVFEGAYYRQHGYYRPTLNSRMRSNDQSFGPINSEQWAERVYEFAGHLNAYSPPESRIQAQAGEAVEFSIDPLIGEGVQSWVWGVDGEVYPGSTNQPNLSLNLPPGSYQVYMYMHDVNDVIVDPSSLAGEKHLQWDLEVAAQ